MIGEEVIAVYGDAGDGEELFEVQKLVRCGECKYRGKCEKILVLDSMHGEIGDYANLGFCSYGSRSEKPNNCESQTEQWHYDEKDNTWYPYQHKSCATCKHALGNWDEESNNCGRCCGADRRFYEPIEDEQTERRTDRDGDVWEWRGDAWYCIGQADTPQTDIVFYDYDPNTDDVHHIRWSEPQTDCGWGEPNE